MKQNQSGFTLIEIAIVLVIIGLLLGGVMKGQELINSAKVKNLANDFRNIPVYIYTYQDKFRALPGDDALVATHVTGAQPVGVAATLGNGMIDGKWDQYTAYDAATTTEATMFWQHIRLAGIAAGITVPGINTSQYPPTNTLGGLIGVTNSTATDNPVGVDAATRLKGTYIICSGNIQGKFAKQLDIILDDGATNTGSMQTIAQQAPGVVGIAATVNPDDTTLFTVCMGV
jgi:prepilin-type N-terminal cleavage/methylation domain-containing protein